MSKLLHMASAAAVAALALTATPAAAQQASPTRQATATARIVKPLTIEWVSDLDLGNVILSAGTWSGAVVGIDRTGTEACNTTYLTCTGTKTRAAYRVTGTNNQTVRVNVAPTLALAGPGTSTLSMAVDSPGTFSLGSSGASGTVFYLGGSLAVDAATPDGTYTGTFAVTVEYN